MFKKYIGLHLKYPLFLSDRNETSVFPTDLGKILNIPYLIKIRPVGAELFHADGRTDMTKLKVAFCDSANAPKIVRVSVNVPSSLKVSCNCFNVWLSYINTYIRAAPRKESALRGTHSGKYTDVHGRSDYSALILSYIFL